MVYYYLVKEPGTEDNLRRIVDNQDFAQLEGLSVFHELRAEYLEEKQKDMRSVPL